MSRIPVKLGNRSYSVVVNEPIERLARHKIWSQLNTTSLLLVTSQSIKKFTHLSRVVKVLQSQRRPVFVVVLPDGEKIKNVATLERLWRHAARCRLDRRSVVVALGGGVITDVAGFFAATYMRGLPFISIPTTLLGMVDAAIGGKTGIDLREGKNLVGAFWQPSLVWVDGRFLATLPARQWQTGMAEVVKYGVILSSSFFRWLEKMSVLGSVEKWSKKHLEHMLSQSIRAKAKVVGGDERENPLGGGREILNFGHTIGHALEACGNYHLFTHGEAVAIGMICAGRLALELGEWDIRSQIRLIALLDAFNLPLDFPSLSVNQWRVFWSALGRDKKHIGGNLRFVLPVEIGKVRVVSGITLDQVHSALHGGKIDGRSK